MYIRQCGSTLYVGLARTVSPTNTNLRLTFLLTRLQEALYEDLVPPKTVDCCDLFILIIIIIIFIRVFSGRTEAIATSPIPLINNSPEIYALLFGLTLLCGLK